MKTIQTLWTRSLVLCKTVMFCYRVLIFGLLCWELFCVSPSPSFFFFNFLTRHTHDTHYTLHTTHYTTGSHDPQAQFQKLKKVFGSSVEVLAMEEVLSSVYNLDTQVTAGLKSMRDTDRVSLFCFAASSLMSQAKLTENCCFE